MANQRGVSVGVSNLLHPVVSRLSPTNPSVFVAAFSQLGDSSMANILKPIYVYYLTDQLLRFIVNQLGMHSSFDQDPL